MLKCFMLLRETNGNRSSWFDPLFPPYLFDHIRHVAIKLIKFIKNVIFLVASCQLSSCCCTFCFVSLLNIWAHQTNFIKYTNWLSALWHLQSSCQLCAPVQFSNLAKAQLHTFPLKLWPHNQFRYFVKYCVKCKMQRSVHDKCAIVHIAYYYYYYYSI